MDPTVYRPIPEWPGYCAGSDGSVWTRKKVGCRSGLVRVWKKKKLTHSRGRLVVGLWKNNCGRAIDVGVLVLNAFVGPCPDGMECCHNDGDARNNTLDNLRWDTHKSNCEDTVKHDRSTRGERQWNCKLTAEKVREIRRLCEANGLSQYKVARMFGIARTTVAGIVHRERWQHIV